MPERVFVSSRVGLDGEQFCIVRADAVPLFPIGSVTEIPDRIAEYGRQLKWLTEDELRHHLADEGVPDEEVDRQVARSRALRRWMPDHVLERMTRIGHRNEHGQVVVAKTATPGSSPFERVFVLRCERCGFQHGTDGSEIHMRRCPACPGGVPGVSV